jgi:hypothetical protein
MDIFSVKLTEVRLLKFLPKQMLMDFLICYDDGTKKSVTRSISAAEDPIPSASDLIHYIKVHEGAKLFKLAPKDDMFANYIDVIVQDEKSVSKQLADYLDKLFSVAQSIRKSNSADGYLDKLNSISNASVKF